MLESAGLPLCFWPYVAMAYCFLNSIDKRGGILHEEQTPYYLRHKFVVPEDKSFIPGQLVYFKPAETIWTRSMKFEGKLQRGIFLNYKLGSGMKYTGQFVVALLSEFSESIIHPDTPASDFEFHEHVTELVINP